MNKKRGVICCLIILSVLTLIPYAVYAGEPAVSVDETLYANLDYYGAVTDLSVVKGCSLNGNTEYVDYGSYEKVTNMSNYVQPVNNGRKRSMGFGGHGKRTVLFSGRS